MTRKSYRFQAPIVEHRGPKSTYCYIHVPDDCVASLPAEKLKGRPRLLATMNGVVEAPCALIPGGGGTYRIMASKALQRKLGAIPGDVVDVSFVFDSPNQVYVPKELEEVLKAFPEARPFWDELTPGRKRGLSHAVATAKTSDTRRRRAQETIESLLPIPLAIRLSKLAEKQFG